MDWCSNQLVLLLLFISGPTVMLIGHQIWMTDAQLLVLVYFWDLTSSLGGLKSKLLLPSLLLKQNIAALLLLPLKFFGFNRCFTNCVCLFLLLSSIVIIKVQLLLATIRCCIQGQSIWS